MSGLPPHARIVLQELLEGRGRRDLAERSARLTAAYRAASNSREVVNSESDALAYAAARMPATFAAMRYAFRQLAAAAPDLVPKSLIDAGCGPGSGALAAVDAFGSLEELTLIDRNEPLLAVARRIAGASADRRRCDVLVAELTASKALPEADLVVAGYVLAELPDADGEALAMRLWSAARQALVIAEPGTPAGFRRILRLRDRIVAAGGHIAAPCTHRNACPMTGADWCRTPVRVERSRDHRMLKSASLGHEDEPLAYLAVTREPPSALPAARIVAEPRCGKTGVRLRACAAEGSVEIATPARDREIYKKFRKLRWGDAV